MSKSVFFSFHYQRDSWRVQQVAQMGVVEGQQLLDGQTWEAVKRKGDQAIRDWIDRQMRNKDAVVVLVGAETASRRWVGYEIAKAWKERRPLVGIRINGLADRDKHTDPLGANPFASVRLSTGGTLAANVPLHKPTGSISDTVYACIRRDIGSWIDGAYLRS